MAIKLKPGRYMLLTHGEGYSLDSGKAIRRDRAQRWIKQAELPMAISPQFTPNDDGLFPGMSQTWRVR